ncbi:uncharacterized protein LOC120350602 isoform X3 [Nilaparvata lugens]|nr:uncharacterized protein LOC120350602 isoform X3 [Nilaparvata lugens]
MDEYESLGHMSPVPDSQPYEKCFHMRIFKTISFNKILDYEDATTFSAQVEAILNSRPLIPLSEDPEDLQYISPGHFLIGRPITALPFPLPETTHIDHRSR